MIRLSTPTVAGVNPDLSENMKQRYFVIGAAAVLFLLIILTSIIGNYSKKNPITTPSQVPTFSNTTVSGTVTNPSPIITLSQPQKNHIAFQNFMGILSGPSLQNNASTPANINVPISKPLTLEQQAQQNYNSFNNFLGIILGQAAQGAGTGTQQQYFFNLSITPPSPSNQNRGSANTQPLSFVYYPQCKGPYDNFPLPNGCNVCAAGCGPMSVAMILSSYVNQQQYTPSAVVNLYQQIGLNAGCQGTTIVDNQTILTQNGMKTTDLIYYGNSTTQETIQDMKSYLANGWTLLMLMRFCPSGCGHFVWVTKIDENDHVWAYDPGDARRPVPLDETSILPTPKYYVAIGVRR